ncbi:MAG: hypothetical protein ACR2ML_02975 [Solirubrobacteraceae bacterium]
MLVLAAIAAAPLVGCGGDRPDRFSGEDRQVADVVEALGAAARDRDTFAVCSQILASSVTKRLGRDCRARVSRALASIDDATLEVVNVRVRGGEASATVLTGSGDPPRSGDVMLVREAAGWRVSALGPLPPPAPS